MLRIYFPILILFIFNACCSASFVHADLVGYWNFNDGSFNDSSGNGYSTYSQPGTASTIIADGKVSQALQGASGGKTNYTLTAANVPVTNMSIAFWGSFAGSSWLDSLSLFTSSSNELQLQRNGGSYGVAVYGNSSALDYAGNIASGFHHIALTTDSSTGKATLYVDGALQATADCTVTGTVGYICMTGRYSDGSRNSNAILDEVQFYNAPLSADQVSYIYNNPALYAATEYSRTVTAAGAWSDSAWTANGQENQAWANSASAKLSATDAPTLTVDTNITANSIDFQSGSMTVGGSNTITLNGEKRIGVTNAADTATISAPITTGFTKTGEGTLAISNETNTLTGGLTIEQGKLSAASKAALSDVAITLNGGELDVTAAGVQSFSNAINVGENGGSVRALTSNYNTFVSLSGSGALTTNGRIHFDGTGGFSGSIDVQSDYTRVATSAVDHISVLNVASGAHFNITGSNGDTIKIGQVTGSGELFVGPAINANFEIGYGTAATDTATFSGSIRGNNDTNQVTIKKVGDGTQILSRSGGISDSSSRIAGIVVDAGVLVFNGSGLSADTATGFSMGRPVTVNAGGTLRFANYWNSPGASSNFTVNGGTLQFAASNYLGKATFTNATIENYGSFTEGVRVGYMCNPVWEVTGGTTTLKSNIVLVKDGNNNLFTINVAENATLAITGATFTDLSSHPGANVTKTGAGTLQLDGSKTINIAGTFNFAGGRTEITGGSDDWRQTGYFTGKPVTVSEGATLAFS